MDISATDISARTIRPRTFRPSKMPKVDVSAKTINVCILCVYGGIDVDVCMCAGGMYMWLHACLRGACLCDALL